MRIKISHKLGRCLMYRMYHLPSFWVHPSIHLQGKAQSQSEKPQVQCPTHKTMTCLKPDYFFCKYIFYISTITDDTFYFQRKAGVFLYSNLPIHHRQQYVWGTYSVKLRERTCTGCTIALYFTSWIWLTKIPVRPGFENLPYLKLSLQVFVPSIDHH